MLKSIVERGDVSYLHINYHLRDLKRIGDQSVYGDAFLGTMIETNDVVIKRSKRPKERTLEYVLYNTHAEVAIGLLVVNKLRLLCPNFIFTYGTYTCKHNRVLGRHVGPCEGANGEVPDIVIEAVDKSLTLGNFSVGCTLLELQSIFIQVLLAITTAYRSFNFSHNDLHSGNVLVQRFAGPHIMTYGVQDDKCVLGVCAVQSNVLAKIIDYGRSEAFVSGPNGLTRLCAVEGYSKPSPTVSENVRAIPASDMIFLIDTVTKGLALNKAIVNELNDKVAYLVKLRECIVGTVHQVNSNLLGGVDKRDLAVASCVFKCTSMSDDSLFDIDFTNPIFRTIESTKFSPELNENPLTLIDMWMKIEKHGFGSLAGTKYNLVWQQEASELKDIIARLEEIKSGSSTMSRHDYEEMVSYLSDKVKLWELVLSRADIPERLNVQQDLVRIAGLLVEINSPKQTTGP